ncbi:MAG TPA: CPBP family intramembrane glutamic endopeptidase [Anaerolineales bacterium]|nr:CPBP family intramembrane glutamic endopeptidase [Anaerolineales bacterium]
MIESVPESQHTLSYVEAARQGKHTPWRYVAGTVLILAIWLIGGGIVTAILLILFAFRQGTSVEELTQLLANPQGLGYVPYFLVISASFFPFILAIWLVVRFVHRRPFRTLITGRRAIDWRRFGAGFGVWFLLSALSSLVEYLIYPETYSLQFDLATFLPFALLALILTPIQTSSEELFFRGYLVQAGSLISRSPVFLAIWSGALFTLPHVLNPEVAANTLLVLSTYFALGAFLAWVSIKDGTIELALGAHAANNLFAGLVVTFPDSAVSTPAIFFTTHFDPVFTLITVIVACALFYWIVFAIRSSRATTPAEAPFELE